MAKITINGQTLASTREDSQGEQLTPEELHIILESSPATVGLHQHHDLSLPICGEMTNFRIVTDPKDSQHLLLLCDVAYDDEKIVGGADAVGAFSWSALMGAESSSLDPDYCLYLPFPLYKDRELIESLLECDYTLAVGKWRKKEADPVLVAFLVLIATPLWETVYEKVIKNHVLRLIQNLRPVLPDELGFNCKVEVPVDIYTPRPNVIFLPALGLESLTKIPDGLNEAKNFCEKNFLTTGKQITELRMKLDPTGRFMVLHVQYIDGTHKDYA